MVSGMINVFAVYRAARCLAAFTFAPTAHTLSSPRCFLVGVSMFGCSMVVVPFALIWPAADAYTPFDWNAVLSRPNLKSTAAREQQSRRPIPLSRAHGKQQSCTNGDIDNSSRSPLRASPITRGELLGKVLASSAGIFVCSVASGVGGAKPATATEGDVPPGRGETDPSIRQHTPQPLFFRHRVALTRADAKPSGAKEQQAALPRGRRRCCHKSKKTVLVTSEGSEMWESATFGKHLPIGARGWWRMSLLLLAVDTMGGG